MRFPNFPKTRIIPVEAIVILRITAPSLNHRLISKKLKISPDYIWKKGQKAKFPDFQRVGREDTGIWEKHLSTQQAKKKLDEQFEIWAENLMKFKEVFFEFNALKYDCSLVCKICNNLLLSQIRFQIPFPVQEKLSECKLGIKFIVWTDNNVISEAIDEGFDALRNNAGITKNSNKEFQLDI